MTRPSALFVSAALSVALVGATLLSPATAASAASSAPLAVALAASPAAGHSIAVSGSGLSMFPAFSQGTTRYAVTTDDTSDGSMTITATTSDPSGLVRINGRPIAAGATSAVVNGLTAGQEVSVIISDSDGTAAYSLFYLPADFPRIERTVAKAGRAPGHLFMNLNTQGGTKQYEAITDDSGVPIYATRQTNVRDLKRQPNGHYSVARGDSAGLLSAFSIVELDEAFNEVGRYRSVGLSNNGGLSNTDFHESILRANGNRIVMAYEPGPGGFSDSIAQEINPAGEVVFSWNSRDHVDPATESVTAGLPGVPDYAHLNSIDVMADGDWLMSFRHLSAVFKVARTAHDGYAAGEVIWRLGGRLSDYTFPDDQYGGPCAQHTAREMTNGNILIFDNGSRINPEIGGARTPMCPNPADPDGDRIERVQTRAVEYSLDEAGGNASVAFQWQRDGLFSQLAGSTQRMPNGNTLLGTRSPEDGPPDAIEVNADGNVVWELAAFGANSYRVHKAAAPDVIKPEIAVGSPATGATYPYREAVLADYSCSDRGGSTLQTCTAPRLPGRLLDTSVPGKHYFKVSATDGAGNRTTVTRSYRVVAPLVPDLSVRKKGAAAWVGDGVYAAKPGQGVSHVLRPGKALTVQFKLDNDGTKAGAFKIRSTRATGPFRLQWYVGKRQVTGRVLAGTLRSPSLRPGKSWQLRAVVTRVNNSRPGAQARIRLTATRAGSPLQDAVQIKLRPLRS